VRLCGESQGRRKVLERRLPVHGHVWSDGVVGVLEPGEGGRSPSDGEFAGVEGPEFGPGGVGGAGEDEAEHELGGRAYGVELLEGLSVAGDGHVIDLDGFTGRGGAHAGREAPSVAAGEIAAALDQHLEVRNHALPINHHAAVTGLDIRSRSASCSHWTKLS